ncbi:MAG TPA: NADH-quinone oxidoreductase subunit N [Opitutaceae bacterium]|nr:NADH-quinone oxidoreductase subunit N [Opitutaceae bacterium]
MNADYLALLHALLPEASLVLGALIVLGFDLIAGHRLDPAERTRAATVIGLIAIVAAVYHSIHAGIGGGVFGDVIALDSLGRATRVGVLGLTALTLLLLPGVLTLRHPAEYVAIVLFAATGFTLMAVAQQLLLAFLALELASLSLYVLVGFDKTRPDAAEAALKYFLFGGMSAAFLLFGFSLLYGLTGSIQFGEISRQLAMQPLNPLLVVALVMILAAFGFKAAAAPFHLWAPDAYQGAPASSAALVASASKLAGFTLFVRLLWHGVGPIAGSVATREGAPGWLPVLAVISLLSLLLGNFAALAQTNVRRLLAYSAIAHAGALMLGVMAAGKAGPAPLFYYASTYGLATVGAFGVIAVVERASGCQSIADLAGLHRRSPLLASCLFIFILSLAGIPPLAGFFSKFSVFVAALQLGGANSLAGGLTLLAILLSAVALYYYLAVLKQALVVAPTNARRIAVPASAGCALVIAAALLVLFGLWPSLILQLVR